MRTPVSGHDAHLPYIDAVVDALNDAGLSTALSDANANDPRDGYITFATVLTEPSFGECEVTLVWSEVRGWRRGYSRPEDHGELRDLRTGGLGVLPNPSEVVIWAQSVITDADRDNGNGDYRQFEDEEDGFEAQLRAYWPAAN